MRGDMIVAVLRRLWRKRLFPATLGALLAIGLGSILGATGLLRATVFRPTPWPAVSQLGLLLPLQNGVPEVWSAAQVAGVRDAVSAQATVTWFGRGSIESELLGRAIRVAYVNSKFFEVLAPNTSAGRTFDSQDSHFDRRVVLSGHAKQLVFGGQRAIGGQLNLGGELFTVVGVLTGGSEFPSEVEAWILEDPQGADTRDVEMLVRFRPGASSSASVPVITSRLQQVRPDLHAQNVRIGARFVPMLEAARPDLGRRARVVLLGVGGVFLLVLINVGTVTLLRAMDRQPELALSVALGASTRRLVGEAVLEVCVVVAFALPFAVVIERLFWAVVLSQSQGADLLTVAVDSISLPLLAVLIVATVVFAIAIGPIVRLGSANLIAVSKGLDSRSGGRSGRMRQLLLATQLSATTAFVLVGLLVAQVYRDVSTLDFGFHHDGLVFATVNLTSPTLADPAQARAFASDFAERARTAVGASDIAIWGTTFPHMHADPTEPPIAIDGRVLPAQDPLTVPALSLDVSPMYFRTLGIEVLSGRSFDERDGAGAEPVAIVDLAAASRLWPGENAVGKRIRLGGARSPLPWMTVVGVVGSAQAIHPFALEWQSEGRRFPMLYRPFSQAAPGRLIQPLAGTGFSIAFRTAQPPELLAQSLQRLLTESAPHEQFAFAGDVRQFLDRLGRLDESRHEAMVFLIFGVVGMALALFGLARVVDEVLARKARELGIRSALGAPPLALVTQILRPIVISSFAACLVGAGCVVLFGKAIQRVLQLGAVTGNSSGVAVPPLLIAVGALAVFSMAGVVATLRAARAVRIDPSTALRAE